MSIAMLGFPSRHLSRRGAARRPLGWNAMDHDFADSTTIAGYHAHIYYAPQTRETAARVRDGIGARFTATLGRWHDEAVGPHPISMYQVAFAAAEFPRIVPWLMLNREGLDILVHPLSGDA